MTGADRAKIGLFEEAHDGTLFLDEIGETSPFLREEVLRAFAWIFIRGSPSGS